MLHIDETGSAVSLPANEDQNPLVIIRAKPTPDGTCRYVLSIHVVIPDFQTSARRVSVAATDCDGDGTQNDVVLTRDIDDKVIETSKIPSSPSLATADASFQSTSSVFIVSEHRMPLYRGLRLTHIAFVLPPSTLIAFRETCSARVRYPLEWILPSAAESLGQ